MSVLQCDRNGCKRIMCDHLSNTYGYICNECLNELMNKNSSDIGDFMESEKQSDEEKEAWGKYCLQIFKSI